MIYLRTALALLVVVCVPVALAQREGPDTINSIKGTHRKTNVSKPRASSKKTGTNRKRLPPHRPVVRTRRNRPPAAVATKKPALALIGFVVSQNGRGRFRTIGEAIKTCAPGARIMVRAGLYAERIELNQPLEIAADPEAPKGSVIVQSDAPCLVMQTDRAVVRGLSFRIRPGSDTSAGYTLDIPRGRLVLENCDIGPAVRACVAVRGPDADPVLRQCRLSGETGDGLLVTDGGKGTFEECDIAPTGGAGIVLKQGANPTMRRCKIHNAKGDGARVGDHATGLLEDCDFFDNNGAGVFVQPGGSPTLRRCRIRDNGRDGVHTAEGSQAKLLSCIVQANNGVGVNTAEGGNLLLQKCRVDVFNGIVSWWPMEDNATDVAGDNTGRMVGSVTPMKGVVGQGLFFDGSGHIFVEDADNLKLTESLTICAWISITTLPTTERVYGQILFRGDDRGGMDPYFLTVVANGNMRFQITSDKNVMASVEAPVPVGQFVHVAAVLDAAAGRMRLYRNGEEAAVAGTNIKPLGDLDPRYTPGIGIGNLQNNTLGNHPFHGIIDELQVYNRALSPGEIESIYNRR